MDKQDITHFTVNTRCCATCPFRDVNGRQRNPELAAAVVTRNGLSGSQICHHPNLTGQESTQLCRGHRDLILQLLNRMGFLEEPTDACFDKTSSDLIPNLYPNH